jgi:hypothetical protein
MAHATLESVSANVMHATPNNGSTNVNTSESGELMANVSFCEGHAGKRATDATETVPEGLSHTRTPSGLIWHDRHTQSLASIQTKCLPVLDSVRSSVRAATVFFNARIAEPKAEEEAEGCLNRLDARVTHYAYSCFSSNEAAEDTEHAANTQAKDSLQTKHASDSLALSECEGNWRDASEIVGSYNVREACAMTGGELPSVVTWIMPAKPAVRQCAQSHVTRKKEKLDSSCLSALDTFKTMQVFVCVW